MKQSFAFAMGFLYMYARNHRSVQLTEIKSRQTRGGLYMHPARHKIGSVVKSES